MSVPPDGSGAGTSFKRPVDPDLIDFESGIERAEVNGVTEDSEDDLLGSIRGEPGAELLSALIPSIRSCTRGRSPVSDWSEDADDGDLGDIPEDWIQHARRRKQDASTYQRSKKGWPAIEPVAKDGVHKGNYGKAMHVPCSVASCDGMEGANLRTVVHKRHGSKGPSQQASVKE